MTMKKFSESEDFYRLLFKNSDDAIFVLPVLSDGTLGKFIEVNEIACKRLGYTSEELLALSPEDIDAPDMAERRHSALKELLANKHVIFETILIAKDGRRIHMEINANYFEYKGKPVIVSILRDITERKHAEERIKVFTAAIEQSVNIIFITDVSGNIEYVNPMFEQVTGYSPEEVIGQNPRILDSKETARIVFEEMWRYLLVVKTWRGTLKNRKKDGTFYWCNCIISAIVNEQGVPVNFICMQEDVTEKMQLQEAAGKFTTLSTFDPLTGIYNRGRFTELMDDWMAYARKQGYIGIVSYPAHGNTMQELLKKVDAAVYQAKELGRNKTHLYRDEDLILEKIHTRMEQKGSIQKALRDHRFEPWFQPILGIRDGAVSHYEALARMRDEQGNVVYPALFIDTAEVFGLISHLRSLGFKFSLDDFGVGFTSFRYLQNIEVDYIKIDGSFVKKLTESRNDRLFVKSIVDVAQGMGIKTVAEFVENQATLEILKEHGVDYAQGYFIGKPAPEIV